jgi:hypothetical protein
MADFPTGIRASSIAWLPGSQPVSDERSDAGNYKPVSGINRSTPARIQVSFEGLSRTVQHTIRDHAMAEGRMGSWLLSPELIDVAPNPSWGVKRWRYAGIPDLNDTAKDGHSIAFELVEDPAPPWIERIVMRARTATIEIGAPTTLVGPDTLPTIWSSRLTTPANVSSGAFRSYGNIATDESDGTNYQAFWFAPTGSTVSRVVVVKRTDAGVILWQRWTSTGLDGVNQGAVSFAPAVAALPGGGCVVAARRSDDPDVTSATHVWCLEADGSTRWQRQYALAIMGPAQLCPNASSGEIILGTSARTPSVALVPTLVRLNTANGNLINAHRFTVDGAETELRRLVVQTDGTILFLCRRSDFSTAPSVRSYLVKLTSAFAVSTVCGYGSPLATGPTTYDNEMVVLPDGGLLIGSNGSIISGQANILGLLRVSSTYGVLNHYAYPRTGGNFLTGINHVTAGFDASGAGWLVSYGSATFGLSNALTVLATNTEATGLDYLTELETQLDPANQRPLYGATRYQVDPGRQRLVVHASGSFDAAYGCLAQGWALRQPAATLALDLGGGHNLQGVTTDPAPGSVGSGPTVTRTIVTATATTLSGTASTATLVMTDAAGSLSWDYQRVIG